MFTTQEKEDTLKVYEEVKSMKEVIQRLGYPTRQTFYQWLREKNNSGKKVKPPRKRINNSFDHPLHPSPELKLIRAIQMEIDILNEEVKILKKPRRNKYSLPQLSGKVRLSKSNYYYVKSSKFDNYQTLREKILELFKENKVHYGYRRIHALLIKENIRVSEKVIQRLMKKRKARRKM